MLVEVIGRSRLVLHFRGATTNNISNDYKCFTFLRQLLRDTTRNVTRRIRVRPNVRNRNNGDLLIARTIICRLISANVIHCRGPIRTPLLTRRVNRRPLTSNNERAIRFIRQDRCTTSAYLSYNLMKRRMFVGRALTTRVRHVVVTPHL